MQKEPENHAPKYYILEDKIGKTLIRRCLNCKTDGYICVYYSKLFGFYLISNNHSGLYEDINNENTRECKKEEFWNFFENATLQIKSHE